MIGYGLRVVGDQRAALRFEQFPEIARRELLEKMREITEELHGAVSALVPHGEKGDVAAAVHSGTEDQNDRIRGWVSLAGVSAKLAAQAAALEYGSTGNAFPVSGYTRSMDHVFSMMFQPFNVVIEEYTRAGGLPQMDFLHGPYRDTATVALDELNEVVEDAVRKSNDA